MNAKAAEPNEPSKRELRTDAELWTGILAGPVLWLIQFQTIYTVAGWGCALHSRLPLIFVSAFFFLLVGGSGLLATRHLKQTGTELAARRMRFMSGVGIMSSALFLLVIISQAIATMMLSQCLQ